MLLFISSCLMFIELNIVPIVLRLYPNKPHAINIVTIPKILSLLVDYYRYYKHKKIAYVY